MALFRKNVITRKGVALLQKTQMQSIKLEFTRIATGSGQYGEDELLDEAVGLKTLMQQFSISSVTVVDTQTVKLAAVISNLELIQPYYMGEIGVFAIDPDEGEILYSLAVAYPGKADYFPAYDGSTPVSIGLDTYLVVSNTGNVTIRADPGAYASAKDLNLHIKDQGHFHGVSFVTNDAGTTKYRFGKDDTGVYIMFDSGEEEIKPEPETEAMLDLGDDPNAMYFAEIDSEMKSIDNIVSSEEELTENTYYIEIL